MSKVLSCFWDISINGKPLDDRRRECIDSVNIDEIGEGSDSCSIVVNDPDFVFIEDNIFVEEASVKVSLGWHGDSHRVNFVGFISAIDINFPDTGTPMLTLNCLDVSHLMNRKKKTRSWDKVTRADVVKKIAAEYGLKCEVEKGYTFKKKDTISQSGLTDIEFCENLASEEDVPFICKVINGSLCYVKKGLLKDPVATLYYRKFPYDIVSFSPRINKETQPEETSYADIKLEDKKIDSATATNDTTTRDVQGDSVKTSSKRYSGETGKWS